MEKAESKLSSLLGIVAKPSFLGIAAFKKSLYLCAVKSRGFAYK